MSKYIKLDEAIKRTNQLYHGYEVEEWLESLPTIDIVHCRECKYWKSEHICIGRWGWYGTMLTEADAFCSYGEREDNER